MIDSKVKDELIDRLDRLTPDQQRRVLDYAREIAPVPRGISGKDLMHLAGTLSREDAQEMMDAIHEAEQYAPVPDGRPGRELMEFAGMLSPEEAQEMRRVIEEVCERIPDYG